MEEGVGIMASVQVTVFTTESSSYQNLRPVLEDGNFVVSCKDPQDNDITWPLDSKVIVIITPANKMDVSFSTSIATWSSRFYQLFKEHEFLVVVDPYGEQARQRWRNVEECLKGLEAEQPFFKQLWTENRLFTTCDVDYQRKLLARLSDNYIGSRPHKIEGKPVYKKKKNTRKNFKFSTKTEDDRPSWFFKRATKCVVLLMLASSTILGAFILNEILNINGTLTRLVASQEEMIALLKQNATAIEQIANRTLEGVKANAERPSRGLLWRFLDTLQRYV